MSKKRELINNPEDDHNKIVKKTREFVHPQRMGQIIKDMLKNESSFQELNIDPSLFDNKAIVVASKLKNPKYLEVLLNDDRVDPSVQNNLPVKNIVSELSTFLFDKNATDIEHNINERLKMLKLLLSRKKVRKGIVNMVPRERIWMVNTITDAIKRTGFDDDKFMKLMNTIKPRAPTSIALIASKVTGRPTRGIHSIGTDISKEISKLTGGKHRKKGCGTTACRQRRKAYFKRLRLSPTKPNHKYVNPQNRRKTARKM